MPKSERQDLIDQLQATEPDNNIVTVDGYQATLGHTPANDLVKILTEATDESQYYEIEGNQIEVPPNYVLVQTQAGVFMLEAGSQFTKDENGKIFVRSPKGDVSELGATE